MKEKISTTIDENIMREIDSMIDNDRFRTRANAIEYLLRSALHEKKISQVLILAGGEGTRLRPFTYEMPKPLIPIAGKPMLEHTINQLKSYGIGNILLSVGYKAEKIIQYFGDGSNFGVKIDYIIETQPMGTAGPIKMAANKLDKNFLVLNGDVITNVNLSDLIESHAKNKKIATLMLNEVEDPSKFGVAQLEGNKIVRFVEKPKLEDAPSKLINGGRYVFNKKILNYIGEGMMSLEKDVFPKLIQQNEMAGYVCTNSALYWSDLGTIEALEKIQKDIKDGKINWIAISDEKNKWESKKTE